MHHVFVYGTLKEGFANHPVNTGRRLSGRFCTLQKYPLFIIGRAYLPWLVHQPGAGQQVLGQVYEVSAQGLCDMDALEQVDEAGWYTRARIAVHAAGDSTRAPLQAFVYFGAAQRLQQEPVHEGPLAEFTLAHNRRYQAANPT